jgi:hypothetical protein
MKNKQHRKMPHQEKQHVQSSSKKMFMDSSRERFATGVDGVGSSHDILWRGD